ncbi:hypothetical protein [Leisingera methylohalidivorans]|uniref:Uncharacterized protein n=1 Tax=Leisingera methylohalidivorans DSM 14336 TaxID=999552 RepID=V9VZL1_9RHOB|nr:hypothetical protein [Leisingera methylohalidivorans]AHD03229.1 hypothetical protein METH_17175 [Leisingera methylohalidivorans DSM 14336]
MRWLEAGFLVAIAVPATAASANDGAYATAEPVAITQSIAGGPAGGREGFWLISLGGEDLSDGYRIDPPPQARDRVDIVGATEDGRRIPATLELVRRFGGQVVARASLMESESYASWVADAPVFLRVSIEAGSAPVEMLVGVRIAPAEQTAEPRPTSGIQDRSSVPVPALVVPAN